MVAATIRRRLLALPLLGLVLGLAACDDPEHLRALDTDDLPDRFACDDVTAIAASPDASEALLIGIDDGLAAAALATEAPVHAEYELPDDRLTVRWVAGANVYEGHCGRNNGEPWELDARMDAFTGRVRVAVEPRADGGLALTAELFDVVLAEDGPWTADLALEPTRFNDLPID
jgi:hypothetical protein